MPARQNKWSRNIGKMPMPHGSGFHPMIGSSAFLARQDVRGCDLAGEILGGQVMNAMPLRGCRTIFFKRIHPEGIESHSPGLRVTSYPGYRMGERSTPPGLYPVSMSQSLSSVFLHVVFSTKNRFPFLSDDGVRGQVHAFLGGIAKNLNCPPILVGGVSDHVHILIQLGRSVSPSGHAPHTDAVRRCIFMGWPWENCLHPSGSKEIFA